MNLEIVDQKLAADVALETTTKPWVLFGGQASSFGLMKKHHIFSSTDGGFKL